MPAQTEQEFNQSAESKVIEYAELTRNLEKLRKAELSRTERIYLSTLDHIGSFLANIAYALDSKAGRQPAEIWRSGKATYVSAATFQARKDYDLKFAFNRRIVEKNWALGEKALAACQDYQGTSTLNDARQVF
jgi:hypothetical protein